MNELASPGQLRMSFVRWALLCVPLIVGIGSLMGVLSNSGYGNRWFVALDRPSIVPPGWVFGVAWTLLYTLIALAIAQILNARGAAGRGMAIALFVAQLLLNFLWSPLFFGMRQVSSALLLVVAILGLAALTTWLFSRIRLSAALLMLPYVAWLCFATYLNFEIDRRNPEAETLVPPAASANIAFGQGQ